MRGEAGAAARDTAAHAPPAAYQKAVREQRLALELSAGKRERDFYLKQVDTAKGLAAMNEKQARRTAAAAAAATDGGGEGQQAAAAPQRKPKVNRTFQQRPVREKSKTPRPSNSRLAPIFGQGGGEEGNETRRARPPVPG